MSTASDYCPTPEPIPASSPCSPRHPGDLDFAIETIGQMIAAGEPNLLRLYLNPWVTQACFSLVQLVEASLPIDKRASEPRLSQVFLANSLREALSAAIKLIRFGNAQQGRSTHGWLIDPDKSVSQLFRTDSRCGDSITFIPGILPVSDVRDLENALSTQPVAPGFMILAVPPDELTPALLSELVTVCHRQALPIIQCLTANELLTPRQSPERRTPLLPDIVLLDDSLTDHCIPFGAMVTSQERYRLWSSGRMSTFHSTTFQPNTLSSMHLMRCLERDAAEFMSRHTETLNRILNDRAFRYALFASQYSPSLARLIRFTALDRYEPRAHGHEITCGNRRIFDAVAGVACSIRGHNPEGFVDDVRQQLREPDLTGRVTRRLSERTGLDCVLPAVSGASAVETALRLSIAATAPSAHILALRGGFGGKTLLALAGTEKPFYKQGLDPLFDRVHYLDPFSATAIEEAEQLMRTFPIGIVHAELIQGVGGVREVPEPLLRFLSESRARNGHLLLIDEVQTGMFRTGPFLRSIEQHYAPDLITMGKGVSDMVFPFGLTLYSRDLHRRVEETAPQLLEWLGTDSAYPVGYASTASLLQFAEEQDLDSRVHRAGILFTEHLRDRLKPLRSVSDIRVHGLLIGIELNVARHYSRTLRRLLPRLAMLGLITHPTAPTLVGFCQYEPHVLKLTPPLSISDDEIARTCHVLSDVLSRSRFNHMVRGLRAIAGRYLSR